MEKLTLEILSLSLPTNNNPDLSDSLVARDRACIWHPYSNVKVDSPLYPVKSTEGTQIVLEDGRRLVDGMSSWWTAIHGYNHPDIISAAEEQLSLMPHVMFGGLTHRPAIELAEKLVTLTPVGLDRVFFSDSGSVAVEVSLKLAVQYWIAKGKEKKKSFLSVRSGYYGDTSGAMSLCDPQNGMHKMFGDFLRCQFFAESPSVGFDEPWDEESIVDFTRVLSANADAIAAVVIEPIVQGAGGMRFYSPEYLRRVRRLCDLHDVLLICDEIATGFGRSGKLFACEHAEISPDIMTVGKALTGGLMSFAATLCSNRVVESICADRDSAFMHGPTFMGNPLACAVSLASLSLIERGEWQSQVASIESALKVGLEPCRNVSGVSDVRILGAIGVIETEHNLPFDEVQEALVDAGVWLRPFRNLLYTMPPFVCSDEDIGKITNAMRSVCRRFLA